MRFVHTVSAAFAAAFAAAPAHHERAAAPSALAFSPALAAPGARIDVTYRPAGILATERALVVRGRFRPADAEQIAAARYVVVAALARTPNGSFTGTFIFPDSVVLASFAVEDSAGQRVDANGGKRWELLLRSRTGQPSFRALIESAYEHYGYWGLALESNRRAMRLYPDSLDGWSTLRFHENVALGSTGPEADSLEAWHRKHFAALHARYAGQKQLPHATIAKLYDYAAHLSDTVFAAFWRTRLLTEATDTRSAAQQRGVATLRKWFADHDTVAALAAFDAYWPEARGTHSQLPGWGLQVAVATGDTVAVDRWVSRVRDDGASESSLVAQLRAFAPRRGEALALQRLVLAKMDSADPTKRPLDRSRNEDAKARLKSRAQALGTLGRILASMNRADEAIEALDRAAAEAISPELFRVLADLKLSKGDTLGAARDLAVIAADPGLAQSGRDSLRARLRWTSTDRRWSAALDSAAMRIAPLVLADAVNWAPSPSRVNDAAGKRHTLSELVGGTPTVLVFWATNCGPCVGEIPSLVRMTPALEAKGVKIVSVSIDDVPSATMRKFIESKQMNYPVYYDLQHEASNAFGVVGIPAVFVLDATGHVRFALSELSQLPRQLETLR